MAKTYDFSGYVTRNDILCSDGRTIKENAFLEQDGMEVPLVFGHDRSNPENILGSIKLENRKDGVYGWGSFNDSQRGQAAKQAVQHGDIKYLSIYANKLKQQAGNVLHGIIREVSLVYGGANPGAFIDNAVLQHDDGTWEEIADEANICFFDEIVLSHSDNEKEEKGDKDMADEAKKDENGDRTAQDVLDGLPEDDRTLVLHVIGQAYALGKAEKEDDNDNNDSDDDEAEHSDNEGEDDTMKYNAFENSRPARSNVLSHSDQAAILEMAKDNRVGTFKNAMKIYADENSLQHDDPENRADQVGGFIDDYSYDAILPDYKDVRPGAPELITNDQGWVSTVLNKVHKSPISRIRTGFSDIRKAEELRAKGYQKGDKKTLTGNIKLIRRTTDPQTVYVKNALNKDDVDDITDFDYVSYLYNIDRMMLNEELARAIVFGDGREDGDADKIYPEHIRPIYTDDDIYTIHVDLSQVDMDELQGTNTESFFGSNYVLAETMIQTCLYAREQYKGTGTPDMLIDPHWMNIMLLARDMNGRRIFSSKAELAQAMNVNSVVSVDYMHEYTRTTTVSGQEVTMVPLVIMCNFVDYSLGQTKGGEIAHFTQFDIDFNQMKSLIETRKSGALTRPWSAIAIEAPSTADLNEKFAYPTYVKYGTVPYNTRPTDQQDKSSRHTTPSNSSSSGATGATGATGE